MITITIISIVLAILRVYIGLTVEPEHPSFVDIYKTIAHFFVSGLLVASWYELKTRYNVSQYLLNLAVALSILELTIAIVSRV